MNKGVLRCCRTNISYLRWPASMAGSWRPEYVRMQNGDGNLEAGKYVYSTPAFLINLTAATQPGISVYQQSFPRHHIPGRKFKLKKYGLLEFNMLLNYSRMWIWTVILIPKHRNFVTFSNDASVISILRFRPAFSWRDITCFSQLRRYSLLDEREHTASGLQPSALHTGRNNEQMKGRRPGSDKADGSSQVSSTRLIT
jgi:hypothetical protein